MTTENTITIPLSFLRAVSLFAAYQDVRYYLNGIYVDPDGVLVASNGHQMIVHELGEKSPLPVDPLNGATIIPIDAVQATIRAGRSTCTTTIPADNVTIAASQLIVHTKSGDVSLPYQPIDGKFVDWRQIARSVKETAEKAQGERSICFHWPYLADCQTAFDLIAKGRLGQNAKEATAVQLTLSDNTAAIATCAVVPSTTCYVMPKRP